MKLEMTIEEFIGVKGGLLKFCQYFYLVLVIRQGRSDRQPNPSVQENTYGPD